MNTDKKCNIPAEPDEKAGRFPLVDSKKDIREDYECRQRCRVCPFPGAKCFLTRYADGHEIR